MLGLFSGLEIERGYSVGMLKEDNTKTYQKHLVFAGIICPATKWADHCLVFGHFL